MRIQRLLDMSPAEWAFRGRQEVFKAVERWSPGDARSSSRVRIDRSALDPLHGGLLDPAARDATSEFDAELATRWLARMSGRFFAGFGSEKDSSEVVDCLNADFADEARQLITRADAVCAGRFEILGYGALDFGCPVNWHLDPVSGRESPREHWSRIDPLDPEQVGDSKVVWELNRHQWALDLGQAWRLTGDVAYADAFFERFSDWLEANPYGRGVNWSSALEVALRMMAWCWALALFRTAPAMTPDRLQGLLAAIQRHAGFVERNLSRYFSPNTHLTVEALGLYTVGTLLPELRGARRWRSRGRELLLEQLPVQVSEAGVHFEQSTRYQYYTVEIYLHFALLAARNGEALPAIVHERIAAMLQVLRALMRPDGSLPQVGDTDGGWLCPLVRRDTGDYRGLFATAALLLEDPQLAEAAGALAAEALWFFGPEAVERWPQLTGTAAVPGSLVTNIPGACVTMRSGWGPDAHHLVFDTGPLGCPVSSGHGHADLLSVQCSAFGEHYLVDPGTGCYSSDSPWRPHFRSTRAHSTVTVDGVDQVESEGPFSWRQRPAARLLDFEVRPGIGYAAAQHEAYVRLEDPVTHRRRVWFLDETCWLIVDDLLGHGRHVADLHFQFAPLPVDEEADGWVRARGQSSSLLLKSFSMRPLDRRIVAGARQPLAGWYSPNYGVQVPAPLLTLRVEETLPLRLATVIVPMRDPDAPPPSLAARIHEARLVGLESGVPGWSFPDFEYDDRPLSTGAGDGSP